MKIFFPDAGGDGTFKAVEGFKTMYNSVTSTAVANTVTRTTFNSTVVYPLNLFGHSILNNIIEGPFWGLEIGDTLELFAAGTYSTTANPTLAFRIGIDVGGALSPLADYAAIAAGSNATNFSWQIILPLYITAIGAGGTLTTIGGGYCATGNAGTTSGSQITPVQTIIPSPNTGTTTASITFEVDVKWSAANALNTIVQNLLGVRLIKNRGF